MQKLYNCSMPRFAPESSTNKWNEVCAHKCNFHCVWYHLRVWHRAALADASASPGENSDIKACKPQSSMNLARANVHRICLARLQLARLPLTNRHAIPNA